MISDTDLVVFDLDWFAVDSEGYVGHFATGGQGGVPTSVRSSKPRLDRLVTYFKTVAPSTGRGCLAATIQEYKNADPNKLNLSLFFHMASRGLYSFDVILGQPRPCPYTIIARPESPIQVADLPQEIQEELKRTRSATIRFAESLLFHADVFE